MGWDGCLFAYALLIVLSLMILYDSQMHSLHFLM